jgi:hypothetical protein
MTTSNQSVHDRVLQAITRDGELIAQREQAKADLMQAKQAEDAVRKDTAHAAAITKAKKEAGDAIARAQIVHEAAIAKARVPLDSATKVFEQARVETEGAFNKAKDDANSKADAKAAAENKQAELDAATARATVHRAEQEVNALQQTIDQHRRGMQDKLGLDMSKMIG